MDRHVATTPQMVQKVPEVQTGTGIVKEAAIVET
jgi:hypothetical protein